MVGIHVRKKALLIAGIAVCVGSPFASTSALASNNALEPSHLEAARTVVAEYRDLRRACADLTGDERKACVHELHANISDYRLAKQQLKLGETEDRENIHLVTF